MFSAMSGIRLQTGSIWPTGSMPQACLAPQYEPSQLSELRICWVKPPSRSEQLVLAAVGAVDDLGLAVAVALGEDRVRPVLGVHRA